MPATSIGLGAMLGAGIFVFPGLAGGQAGFAAILSFLIGGIIALFAAACTAELATAMPKSGGGYFFISRSFGRFWGTLTGVAQWIGLIFACAFYLVSFGEYALSLLQELDAQWTHGSKILSFLFTALLLTVNIIGTKKVGQIQNLMVISLTILLTLLFTYGLIEFFGLQDKPVAFSEIAPNGITSVFKTSALIFTSYLGFVQIANIGAEIKEPSKNLPRSLIGSVLLAMGLYAFIMLVCILTFPQEELKKFGETATIEVARIMTGQWGAMIVLFAALLATLSSANASMISASRGVFALSKDAIITDKVSKVNKRFGTPHIALILVTAPIAVMLIRSKLQIFAEVASLLHLIIYAGICLSVLKLRMTRPIWYVPHSRVPAVKFVAGLGASSCLILVFFMQKESILISSGVLLLAALYYYFYVKKREVSLDKPSPPHIDTSLFHPSVLIPIDITQEKKGLPHAILEAILASKILLLGFKETPEQSDSEQSEEEFGESGQEKLNDVRNQLEVEQVDFESEIIFTNKVASNIKQIIKDEQLQFILTLHPITTLDRVSVPVFDLSQVNSKLSTVIHNLHSYKPVQIEVALYPSDDDEAQLKQAISTQFALVNLTAQDYHIYTTEKSSFKQFIRESSKKGDIVVWSEPEPSEKETFLNMILGKESEHLCSPAILILNENSSRQGND